jgi:hypothetical protein
MSRLLEWVERQEQILVSMLNETDSRIEKYKGEINGLMSERVENERDLSKLRRAKAVIVKLENEEDCNGQLKLEGMNDTTR